MTETRTTRIELRTQERRAQRLRYAAELSSKSLSAFMLDAATDRAEEVIAAATETTVPSSYFDELFSALDEPPKPNVALARRSREQRKFKQR